MSVTFDDFDNEELIKEEIKPFCTVNTKNKDELLEWLNKDYENKIEDARPRLESYRYNLALFKGIHYRSMDSRDYDRRGGYDMTTRKPKIVVNFVQEMVSAKTAKMAEKKPAIDLLPNNDETSDKMNAKAMKALVDNRYHAVNIDDIYSQGDEISFLFGDSYTKICWDENEGPYAPEFLELKQLGLSEKDIKKRLKDNNINFKVGDVAFKVYGPDRCFPQLNKRRYSDVEHITCTEWYHVEEVKKDYPRKAEDIKPDGELKYDADTLEVRQVQDEVIVKEFFHKPTKHVQKGIYVKYTQDAILEVTDFPYSHGELPFSKLSDIDVYGELHGRSFIRNIAQLQRHYNSLASGIARNHGIASAPKWLVPKGCCSLKQLNNELTVLEFTGPVAPKLQGFNSTPTEIFNYMDKLENLIEKQSVIYGVSRGEPPTGVTAAVALKFLDEQEQRRENRNIIKKYSHIRKIFELTMKTMAQYYEVNDGRMVNILGKDNSHLIQPIKEMRLDGSYSVVIKNVSALPESKAGRIQTIIDLNNATNTSPEGPVFRREEIIDMLDMGMDDKFVDKATIGIRAAEYALDMVLTGKEAPEPQIYDDLINEWDVFLNALRERTYKTMLSEEIKQALIQRLTVVEGLMYIRSTKSPLFANKLKMLEDYPIFFNVPAPAMPPQAGAGSTQEGEMDTSKINPMNVAGEPASIEQTNDKQ